MKYQYEIQEVVAWIYLDKKDEELLNLFDKDFFINYYYDINFPEDDIAEFRGEDEEEIKDMLLVFDDLLNECRELQSQELFLTAAEAKAITSRGQQTLNKQLPRTICWNPEFTGDSIKFWSRDFNRVVIVDQIKKLLNRWVSEEFEKDLSKQTEILSGFSDDIQS